MASSTDTRSTLARPAKRSNAAWVASAPRKIQEEFLNSLSEDSLMALPWLFEFWALPHQLPPEGDWKTWIILGGRGAGKTHA
ncbi:MAG: ATP-binding protein, partial [Oceanicola sp.]|nr:ATP-binding protein [Oceanicola sp.]